MSPTSGRQLKIIEIVLWVCVAVFVANLLVLGLLPQKETKVGSTLQTSAIVVDKEIQSPPPSWEPDYYVSLDFSKSQMTAELRDLLGRREQSIKLGSQEEFYKHFYMGREVSVVYHVVDLGHDSMKVAIESVDGYEPKQGLNDLTTPGWQKSQDVSVMILLGGFLAFFALCLGAVRWLRRWLRKSWG